MDEAGRFSYKEARENKKKFIRYKEGVELYSIGISKFQEIAKPLITIGNSTNHEFTERELDILRELTTGDSNTEIGDRLGISASTVKYHVENLLSKTGFHTRTELASEARSLGIVIKEK